MEARNTNLRRARRAKALLVSTLLGTLLAAGGALAGERGGDPSTPDGAGCKARYADTRTHRGLVIGLNAGAGGSNFQYKDGSRSITEDPLGGGFGQMRVAMDVSRKFAIGVEGVGFDSKEDEADWELGAALLTVTWRPTGRGFFLRAGGGVGGGDFTHPDTGEQLNIATRGAWLFGAGYEWRLGRHAGLGLAVDGFGVDGRNLTGHDDDHIGAGGMTAQFNWYL